MDGKKSALTMMKDLMPIIVSVILIVVLALCITGATTSEDVVSEKGLEFSVDGYRYSVLSEKDRTVELVRYMGTADEVVIPKGVYKEGSMYTVESIGEGAFKDCTFLKSVKIDVPCIDNRAFEGCSRLEIVQISENVISVPGSAFDGCTGLKTFWVSTYNKHYCTTGTVIFNHATGTALYTQDWKTLVKHCSANETLSIPHSIEIIGDCAFSDSRIKELEIPSNVKRIEDNAFRNCKRLIDISLNDGLKYLGAYAFKGCSKLEHVVTGNELTDIWAGTFEDCKNLRSFTFGKKMERINQNAFDGCVRFEEFVNRVYNEHLDAIGSSLYNNLRELVMYPKGRAGPYTVPNVTTAILDSAFQGCKGLTEITIPTWVDRIDARAFENCTNLTQVKLGNDVTSLGNFAFRNCVGLTEFLLTKSVERLGTNVFEGCSNLMTFRVAENNTSFACHDGVLYTKDNELLLCPTNKTGDVQIPDSTRSIGEFAFRNCVGIENILIPASVTSIGNFAFKGCTGLTSVLVPGKVTHYGVGVFYGCENLKAAHMNNNMIDEVSDSMFYGCRELRQVDMPARVELVEGYAFSNCVNLVRLDLPNVTQIRSYAFEGCEKLNDIAFSDNLKSIGGHAFSGCLGLVHFYVPSSTEDITFTAFYGCRNIASFEVGNSSSDFRALDGVLYKRNMWGEFTLLAYPEKKAGPYALPLEVTTIPVGAFGDNKLITDVTVSKYSEFFSAKDGVLYNYEMTQMIYCPPSKKTITVPSSVESIRDDALGREGLTAIYVEEGSPYLRSVDGVLYNYDMTELIRYPRAKLGSFVIPSSVSTIGNVAFWDCHGLLSLSIPAFADYNKHAEMWKSCRNLSDIWIMSTSEHVYK